MFIELFVVVAIKDSIDFWLYELRHIPRVFKQSLFIHQLFHLLISFVVVSLFIIILVTSLNRAYKYLGSLRDIF